MDTDEEIREILENLKRQGVEKIVAFSGGSEAGLESKVQAVVEQSMEVLRHYPVGILSGGTKWGLPMYSSMLARKKSIPMLGVYPIRGQKYSLGPEIDFAIEVKPRYGDSEWGDESEIFAKLANGVEIIGGSFGTLIEFAHIMKSNERKIKEKTEPTYVAPIIFTGMNSVADIAYDFCRKPELSICLPEKKIVMDGKEAAKFLIDKLKL